MNTAEEQEYDNHEYYVVAEMQRAIDRGDDRIVQWCIDEDMYIKGCYGEEAVQQAAKNGNNKILDILLKSGAPVSQLALTNAIESKSLHCVKSLLQRGAVPNFTSMNFAVEMRQHRMVKALLEAGGSVNYLDWRVAMASWPLPRNNREMRRQQETMAVVLQSGGIY